MSIHIVQYTIFLAWLKPSSPPLTTFWLFWPLAAASAAATAAALVVTPSLVREYQQAAEPVFILPCKKKKKPVRRSLFLFKLRFKIPVRVRTAFYLFERAEAFPSIFGSSCSLKKRKWYSGNWLRLLLRRLRRRRRPCSHSRVIFIAIDWSRRKRSKLSFFFFFFFSFFCLRLLILDA